MDKRRISFARALSELQGMLGARIQVAVNLPGYFFDCGFRARLLSARSLDEEGGAVLLVFGHEQGIAHDPDELDCFLVATPCAPGRPWLELRVGDRAVLLLSRAGA
ncbi:MAG: hypothetical protein JJE35_03785 [Thermoleophilia bacterium]|nr:hypothetical protein [Thermoleophilia bacterium]